MMEESNYLTDPYSHIPYSLIAASEEDLDEDSSAEK